jgi:hypothetical protein
MSILRFWWRASLRRRESACDAGGCGGGDHAAIHLSATGQPSRQPRWPLRHAIGVLIALGRLRGVLVPGRRAVKEPRDAHRERECPDGLGGDPADPFRPGARSGNAASAPGSRA